MDVAWRSFLNLLMRDIREWMASTSLGVAFCGVDGWLMRWRAFAGSAAGG
jgi:hypothetical protein